MDARQIVNVIVDRISKESGIEGVFLSGSLAGADKDEFSDVDLGIASKDNLKDYRKAYGLYEEVLKSLGHPLQVLEREWEHCQMVAALYGKSQFPPIGLEVDLVFSQLKYVTGQMPYRDYEILFDRTGKLATRLEAGPQQQSMEEIETELKQNARWYPFHVYESLRALGRRDRAGLNAHMEELRKTVFHAAAVRRRAQVRGPKRGFRHLSPDERWTVDYSYQTPGKRAIQQLSDLYVNCLNEMHAEYALQPDVEQLRRSLAELL
jgi:hypothetical protein